MAFDLSGALGYGEGASDLTPAAGDVLVNAYAKVTAVTSTTITIADATANAYSNFNTGSHVLLHIIDMDSDSYNYRVGCWRVCKVTAKSGNVLTVTNKPTKIISANGFSHCRAQLIAIPQFKNVTLNSGVSIKPAPYADGKGGVVALKCCGTLTLNGGHIDLANAGLGASYVGPDGSSTHRKLLAQEAEWVTADYAHRTHTGWENYACAKHLTLNQSDGAAFILCDSFVGNSSSRIGNPNSAGVHFQTGTSNDNIWKYTTPVGVISNYGGGGSSILLCARAISGLNVKTLSKYPATPSGYYDFGRIYIATENQSLSLDEGLYARDVISTPERLTNSFNIKNFGDGSDGAASAVTSRFNTYVKVTEIDSTRSVFTYSNKMANGAALFKVGALVMVHIMHKAGNVKHSGRFHIAKIIGFTSNKITIDTPMPKLSSFSLALYDVQILTIPQFSSLDMSNVTNSATPAYANGRGGILAIACSGTVKLQGAKLNVETKGGGEAYGSDGLKYISNAGMANRLPLGQGHGSVFILANQIEMDSSTRIGATYDGSAYGGGSYYKCPSSHGYVGGAGGYGVFDAEMRWLGGAKKIDDDYSAQMSAYGGGAGTNAANHNGGYGSNATDANRSKNSGLQGAHILIVADKITGFNQAAISTGGGPGNPSSTMAANPGGAGYGGGGARSFTSADNGDKLIAIGGGGGFHAGGAGSGDKSDFASGGGSSGFAFVYCNSVVNQDTSNTLLD